MPRRLDPRKGLPGLFAPGSPKAADMAFLVQGGVSGTAEETPPKAKSRPKARKLPPPRSKSAEAPLPDYLRLAPPFRAVPTLKPEPEPIRLAEIPSFISCAVGWLASALGVAP